MVALHDSLPMSHYQKILITGAAGFVGSHLVPSISKRYPDATILLPTHHTHDLLCAPTTDALMEGVDLCIHLAAKVGGIGYNRSYPADLLYANTQMGLNIVESARKARVQKVILLGTICSYPKYSPLPFQEENIWNGYPEETNAPYGIAKRVLLELARSYHAQYGMNIVTLLPTNLYGPNDNFSPRSSHVIPALIRKFLHATREHKPSVSVWGSGNATRDFLYVTDAVQAILLAVQRYDSPLPLNLGSGVEVCVAHLSARIAALTGFTGEIRFDHSFPDGQPRRQVDTTKARQALGFAATTKLDTGLKRTLQWYLDQE